jgi:hypothetical protein
LLLLEVMAQLTASCLSWAGPLQLSVETGRPDRPRAIQRSATCRSTSIRSWRIATPSGIR